MNTLTRLRFTGEKQRHGRTRRYYNIVVYGRDTLLLNDEPFRFMLQLSLWRKSPEGKAVGGWIHWSSFSESRDYVKRHRAYRTREEIRRSIGSDRLDGLIESDNNGLWRIITRPSSIIMDADALVDVVEEDIRIALQTLEKT